MSSVSTVSPADLPACRNQVEPVAGHDVLLWVHTGCARVVLSDGRVHLLTQHEGIRVPASMLSCTETGDGSVAIPLHVIGESSAVRRFWVPDGWRDWLLLVFAFQIAPLTNGLASGENTLPRVGYPASGQTRGHTDALPLPRTAVAAEIAGQLIFEPAIDHSADDWARLLTCSPRTISRAFVRETGMSFERWRTECRLVAAAVLIAAGKTVTETARAVGLSRDGLSRSFRSRYASSPSTYRPVPHPHPIRSILDQLSQGLLPIACPTMSATFTRRVVNDFSVLVWVYRGSAQIRVGRHWHRLSRGDALWLPVGIESQTITTPGSVLLPVGAIMNASSPPTEPLRTSFDSEQDATLLHHAVSRYTMLRPSDYDERIVRHLFNDQFQRRLATNIALPSDPGSRAAALSWITAIGGIGDCADPAGGLDNAQLPMPRKAWEHHARMQIGSLLLHQQTPVDIVSRQLGYRYPQNFTRAFRKFHGFPPSHIAAARGRVV